MNNKGFTLIELLSTIAIIAVVTTIGIVTYQQLLRNSRDAKRQTDLKAVQSVLEQYRVDQGFYPSNPAFNNALPSAAPFTNLTGNPANPPPPTKTYLKNLPTDFPGSLSYKYIEIPTSCNNAATLCTDYCLYATVENATNGKDISCANQSGYNLEVTKP